MMDSLHPAAIRAAERIASGECDYFTGSDTSVQELIHDAIDDHLKSEEWQRVLTLTEKLFQDRLKSEGWEELSEVAQELISTLQGCKNFVTEADKVAVALRRVRGEKL
ncbi:MAG: hypothetical protein V3R16_02335 [Nitrospirales bacterium]